MKIQVMLRLRRWCLALLLCLLVSCANGDSLSNQEIDNYLQAYRELRQKAPEMAQQLVNSKLELHKGLPKFNEFEQVIKDAGFENSLDFARVNAAVTWSLSQLEGSRFLKNTDQQMQQLLKDIDQKLQSNTLTAELRQQLETQKAQLKAQFEENKPWADAVQKGAEFFNDPATLETVKARKDEILAVLSGKP